MRDIKFRVYSKEYGMCEGLDILTIFYRYIAWCKDNEFNTEKDFRDSWSYWGVNLMQYTGLQDKSGKEIYEGDILRDAFEGYEFLTTVEWWDIGVWGRRPIPFEKDIDYYTFAFNYNNFDKVEVIGNIHENRGLLNVK